jgi:SAM-dependent methyltransferase
MGVVRQGQRVWRSWWRRFRERPPVGMVRFGSLRRTTPIGHDWGLSRGRPVDRVYIERFMEENRKDIKGHVLEIQDAIYTRKFDSGVVRREILDIDPENPAATIVADLTTADEIAANTFDCVVLPQTLDLIHHHQAALRHVHRILRPGGVLLATVPGIAPVVDPASEWRYTPRSAHQLFGGVFGPEAVRVESFGNVLVATAFLFQLSVRDLRRTDFEMSDPAYPMLIGIRAEKAP